MNERRLRRIGLLSAGGLLLGGLLAADAPPAVLPDPSPESALPAGPGCATNGPEGLPAKSSWLHRPHDPCATIPCGAIPVPNGTVVRLWSSAMAARANADDFVVYKHEWYMGGSQLGPYGLYHLQQMAARLPHQPFLVILQPEPPEQLTETRRIQLIQLLTASGVPDAARRVVVAYPEAEGMDSLEAARNYYRSLRGSTGVGGTSGYGVLGGVGGGMGGFGTGTGSLGTTGLYGVGVPGTFGGLGGYRGAGGF
jgi:hypothetical protein